MTASDTRTVEDDVSGAVLRDLLLDIGAEVIEHVVVEDSLSDLTGILAGLAARPDVNLVLSTGGTGLSPRDNTPEATRAVIEREVPGIAEAMRRGTSTKTPMAMLSCGIAGIRNNTLIINLPGSPKAVRECFEILEPVLSHAIDLIEGRTDHSQASSETK